MRAIPGYVRLATSGLRRRPLRTALAVLGVALSTGLLLGTLSLHAGYVRSLDSTIDRMGYQVLVTAKGCPYEAASLVMRGGNVPMYIDESTFDQMRTMVSSELAHMQQLDFSVYFEIGWHRKREIVQSRRLIKQIEASAAEFYATVAKEFGVPHEEAALRKILTDNALKSDLVHPNAAGYARLAEAIAALLRKTGAV